MRRASRNVRADWKWNTFYESVPSPMQMILNSFKANISQTAFSKLLNHYINLILTILIHY